MPLVSIGGRLNSLFVGLFTDFMGVTLGLVGDPIAGVSEGVHFEIVWILFCWG